jgi:hypothetical protein
MVLFGLQSAFLFLGHQFQDVAVFSRIGFFWDSIKNGPDGIADPINARSVIPMLRSMGLLANHEIATGSNVRIRRSKS